MLLIILTCSPRIGLYFQPQVIMSNILVIADQPRTQEIVASALEDTPVTVKFVSSLKHAEEVPAGFPAVLLIQDRLSGLSGEILARHLRAIFSGETIAVFLLTDDPASAGKMRFIDGCIDLRLTDAEVVESLRETVAMLPKEETAKVAPTPDSPIAHDLASGVEDRVGIFGHQQPKQEPPVGSPFSSTFDSALSEQSHVPLPLAEKEQELDARQRQAAESLLKSPPKRPLGWIYLTIATALAAGAYFLAGGKAAPPKPPAPQALAPKPVAKPLPGITSLPPLVPLKGLDPGYAKKHPGWERYTDSSQEYKIYRKDAVIQALQIIDHSGKGLSPGLIGRVLQETTGNNSYAIASTTPKEGFVVEKGTAAANAKIILYKRRSDRQVSGMVLHFD